MKYKFIYLFSSDKAGNNAVKTDNKDFDIWMKTKVIIYSG